jgi:TetR/AcrR family transcriptional regulator, regulator of autoinduction and epiphytic fitness
MSTALRRPTGSHPGPITAARNATLPTRAQGAYNLGMKKPTMREHLLQVREHAIVDTVNKLLADKGYDLMTVDEVAANAGLSKASLYTHFRSKEELAAAAMVRVLERAIAFAKSAETTNEPTPVGRLVAVVRWTLRLQIAGAMPSLPAQNSTLRNSLSENRVFTKMLFELSDLLGGWIEEAQTSGVINPDIPGEVVLYTVYARACDQVLQVLKAGGQYTDEQIIDFVVNSCFVGLVGHNGRSAALNGKAVAARQDSPRADSAATRAQRVQRDVAPVPKPLKATVKRAAKSVPSASVQGAQRKPA